ncbi:tetratricopeptide repeat protein, partial [Candidatus Kapabacteria bacterium]|nr:tetratricopeptide repeat protein [Candidatus Kapabacteria bacterium]
DWTKSEINNFFEFKLDAFRIIISHYFNKKELRKSLEYCKKVQMIDPFDSEINKFIVQIYRELGEIDEAIRELTELTENNPDNEIYWVLLADLYANIKEYDKAIENYNKAIRLNSNYGIAYRNLGSTNKNIASNIQKVEQEKLEKDKNYVIKKEEYFKPLGSAAEAFEKCLETEDYRNNAEVLSELAQTYHVLDEVEKLNITLAKLENIESQVPKTYLSKYYYNLLNIYSNRSKEGNNATKASKINTKIEELQKNGK